MNRICHPSGVAVISVLHHTGFTACAEKCRSSGAKKGKYKLDLVSVGYGSICAIKKGFHPCIPTRLQTSLNRIYFGSSLFPKIPQTQRIEISQFYIILYSLHSEMSLLRS
jgi:hypothetical protein